jgi:hypothetical protein
MPATHANVRHLTYGAEGLKIFMDYFCSSPRLFDDLDIKQICAGQYGPTERTDFGPKQLTLKGVT